MLYREEFKNRNMPRRRPQFVPGEAGDKAAKLKEFGNAGGTQSEWLSDAGRNDFSIVSGIKKEQKYYGVHACQAIWQERPTDLIRVYLDPSHVKKWGALLKWCAQHKKAYHLISPAELEKVTDSVHHEGICLLAKARLPLSEKEFRQKVEQKGPLCLLYLDGVENPHNIGSILRTAAHFGIRYLLSAKLPPLSPSACRIAKGGAEKVELVSLSSPLETLRWLKQKGFVLYATSSHRGAPLFQTSLAKQTIFAMGAESEGLSQGLMKLADQMVQIPGTEAVESLNVSVAAAFFMGEYCRQHT